MSRALDIAAKILSVVFYPLFVPTYGIALFCYSYGTLVQPMHWVWITVAIVGTLLLTAVIPITAIWIMMRKGSVTDMQIANPKERTIPYLYSILGFAFWCYLLISILQVPVYLSFVGIGATVAIGLVTLINRFWKISAHLTGLGGLFGGLMSYCIGIGAIPTIGTMCIWLGVVLIVMYARLRLNAHTPAQVCAGFILGVACTAIPYCIYHLWVIN
jgi:membrane-associated phospholipid phosphatase